MIGQSDSRRLSGITALLLSLALLGCADEDSRSQNDALRESLTAVNSENASLRASHAGLDKFVAGAVATPMWFSPGAKYSYSSMGTLLSAYHGCAPRAATTRRSCPSKSVATLPRS